MMEAEYGENDRAYAASPTKERRIIDQSLDFLHESITICHKIMDEAATRFGPVLAPESAVAMLRESTDRADTDERSDVARRIDHARREVESASEKLRGLIERSQV